MNTELKYLVQVILATETTLDIKTVLLSHTSPQNSFVSQLPKWLQEVILWVVYTPACAFMQFEDHDDIADAGKLLAIILFVI